MITRWRVDLSVVITTNLAFAEWPKVFGPEEKLTTALLDRFAATVITTKGKSYRVRKRGTHGGPVTTSESTPTTSKKKD